MYCSNCGKKIQDEAKYCMYCGSKVVNSEEIKEEVKEENKPVEVETEVVEETVNQPEEKTEIVEETTNEEVKTEVVEEKIEVNDYDVKSNNSTITIEPKKEKSSYLSTVLTINYILLAFKVLGAIFVAFALNTNSFNRTILGTVRVYGMYNLELVRIIIGAVLVLSIVFTGVITFFEYKADKNKNKSDVIVAFIMTCVKYGYMILLCLALTVFGLGFVGLVLIVIAVLMIILTYKALQEAKEKFN